MIKKSLLIVALLLGATPANATILAACSEDISCVFQGTVNVVTTAGRFNAGYARFSLQPSAGSTTVPPPSRLETDTFSAASSDFWTTLYYYSGASTTTNNIQGVLWSDTGTGVVRVGLETTGTAQQIRAYKRDATPTKTTLATATGSLCAGSTLCKLDVHIVYTASGSIDVYNNGVNILTFSGDFRTNGITALDKVAVGTFNTSTTLFSEFFVSDTDTRSMKMVTCAPSAAGTTQNWTGAFGNINANSYDDTVFNYTTTNNDLSNWKSGCTISTTAGTSIVDVQSYGRLAIGATGPQNARFSTAISGTDYDSGSDLVGLTTSFGNFRYDWGATSPAGGAWSPAGLNTIFGAGGFGVKSRP